MVRRDCTEDVMKKKALKHVMAVGLAALVSMGATSIASARTNARDYVGVWRLDEQRGNGWGRDGNWNDRGWNDDRYGNDRYGNHRDGRNDRRDSGHGSRGGWLGARLPETFRIERNRRDFEIESMNGRTIRDLDVGRNRQLVSQRTVFGARIFETYSLVNGGRRLLVRTQIRTAQGTREMTSFYEKA